MKAIILTLALLIVVIGCGEKETIHYRDPILLVGPPSKLLTSERAYYFEDSTFLFKVEEKEWAVLVSVDTGVYQPRAQYRLYFGIFYNYDSTYITACTTQICEVKQ